MKKILYICVLMLALPCMAQNNIIDEVIWIVGDDAILRSEVEEERLRAQYEGQPIAGDPYCVIPEQLAVQKLFLHQAELDSIEVSESTVSHQVDMRMNYYISQIGSKEKMEEYFRKPSSEIREEMMKSVRNQMTIQQMQQKLTSHIKPTPAEIRRYYNTLPMDSIPMMPAEVEVQILSFVPPVPVEETERIKSRLREFTERVVSGQADFAMLARFYSEDTESAKHGGELGFVGRGQLVPEFAEVAFALNDPKKVSRIVETEYGFHIIQLIEKHGERINCRHILLKPQYTSEDREKAFSRLDSLRTKILDEEIAFPLAARFFSEDPATRTNGGQMADPSTGSSYFEIDQLKPADYTAIQELKEGEISEPVESTDNEGYQQNRQGNTVYKIIRVDKIVPAHPASFTNDYTELQARVRNQRQMQAIDEFLEKRIKDTYIVIDPMYKECSFNRAIWQTKF